MIEQISPGECKKLLDTSSDIQLIDVREQWEYLYTHLDGALHIPLGSLAAGVTTIDRDRLTIVYCHHGVRSMQACIYLRERGFTKIRNLEGGIDCWSTIDAAVKRY